MKFGSLHSSLHRKLGKNENVMIFGRTEIWNNPHPLCDMKSGVGFSEQVACKHLSLSSFIRVAS